MLFISGKKSKKEELSNFFKSLYDGSNKEYPNGSMMLFILLTEGTHSSSMYREKILYNRRKHNGHVQVLAVGGLNNLQTVVKLKTGQSIMLRTLLKSLPASQGMSHPLLFQHFEANATGTIHMAIYQRSDHDLVTARLASIQQEILQVLAEGEEAKIFANPQEGLWFGNVHQNSQGRVVNANQPTKLGQEYANRVNKTSPAKPGCKSARI
jgi:hypothetical protein